MEINKYDTASFFDDMLGPDALVREAYASFVAELESLPYETLLAKQQSAEHSLMAMGVTFNVYSENLSNERIMPLDIIPRIIAKKEWEFTEKGLKQRIEALNLFLSDVYGKQQICKDGIVPKHLIESSTGYLEACIGLKPPKNIWIHITGTDLIKDHLGNYMVLEDNLRCPSGVSYMLENREMSKRTFPNIVQKIEPKPVADYTYNLLEMLKYISPTSDGNICLLSPGSYNSAYFEHSYLAQQMGIELVVSDDLLVDKGYVKMRTTKGFEKVDVIYRRMDDTFLDPWAFNPHSLIGIPGLFEVYKKGRVSLANAPGTGVADDKVIYAFVPEIIKYYLGQEAILPNVPTYLCERETDLAYVLNHLPELVVKQANEAGGYGMLIGPQSTKEEQAQFRKKIIDNPRNFIAQPTIAISTAPCIMSNGFEPRHVDLRPYVLYGQNIDIVPGGLTRVALRKGSLVVNSSQGGGSKDTWVL
jgi:uncharacterized circularly permuted ATP-grasp superfamily protein